MARKPSSNSQGQRAEQIAADFLIEHGLVKVAQNCRYKVGELDLVMLDQDADNPSLVFVEVRYRKLAYFGGASASVTPHKVRKLTKAAYCFLAKFPHYSSMACRFDLIAIQGILRAPKITWIKNIIQS